VSIRLLRGVVCSHITPACHWARTPTYLSRAHVMLRPSSGTFAAAKPPRLSPATSPISTLSSMLLVYFYSCWNLTSLSEVLPKWGCICHRLRRCVVSFVRHTRRSGIKYVYSRQHTLRHHLCCVLHLRSYPLRRLR